MSKSRHGSLVADILHFAECVIDDTVDSLMSDSVFTAAVPRPFSYYEPATSVSSHPLDSSPWSSCKPLTVDMVRKAMEAIPNDDFQDVPYIPWKPPCRLKERR